ncbi:MAG: family 78 glycoside hydrolase catalytic domain [Bacteroidales bacterium]|nr:family 78 glycoside hydrolase catalytic domain [Bacteroidales bacterium]
MQIRCVIAATVCFLATLTGAVGATFSESFGAAELTCEYLVNPLCVATDSPRLGWKMVAADDAGRGQMQTAYQILVASDEALLASGIGDLWDSGKVESSVSSQIVYGGKTPEGGSDCRWKVRVWNNSGEVSPWSDVAMWRSSLKDWDAEWIGDSPDIKLREYLDYVRIHNSDGDFDIYRWQNPPTLPSPMLRRSFTLAEEVKNAVVYASALGYYELWINGKRVGDGLQTPGWTDYSECIQYQAYDVASYLREGENVIAATLADGWALGRLAGVKWMRSFPHRGFYATDRRLIARLDVEMADGSNMTVVSDGSWVMEPDGYVREADNFGGETIDLSRMPAGWTAPGFDDSGWRYVTVDTTVTSPLTAQPDEPIRVHTVLKPKRIWKRGEAYMVDFGQNIAGHCALAIKGERGDTVTVRYGEWLNDDGSLYTRSLGYARATDRFILSGGDDMFDPSFTYHGFQYAAVSGIDGTLSEDMIVAKAVSSSARQTGSFECSNPDLNRLFKNILWTQRNNMFGVMTDNPSRDERTGALGDIQIFAQSAIFNMDMGAFFTKFMRDAGELSPNGQFMSMIPSLRYPGVWDGWIGAPGWCEAPFIVAWRMYVNYGDTRGMASLYENMKTHVATTLRENPDSVWRVRHNHNGDWLNANTISGSPDPTYDTSRGATPDDMFATAFLAHSVRLLSKIAGVLGHTGESEEYGALADGVRKVFIREFVEPDGKVAGDTQGAYSLALYYDLVPEELRQAAFGHLMRCIEEYDTRLSTGFITTPMMMQLLADFGRDDVAYKLLTSTRFPSWLYIVRNGATTVWERWDAWIPGIGFQNPSMNSLDHVAFGAVAEWMYRNILGINPDENHPGYEHFYLCPRPGGGLSWAQGSYDSPRGTIASGWREDENGAMLYTFTVPPNSRATIVLPARSVADVVSADGGKLPDFRPSGYGTVKATVGSGTYRIRIAASHHPHPF